MHLVESYELDRVHFGSPKSLKHPILNVCTFNQKLLSPCSHAKKLVFAMDVKLNKKFHIFILVSLLRNSYQLAEIQIGLFSG